MGTWCSGITPAQHAGGPGFNPQCVQFAAKLALTVPALLRFATWRGEGLGEGGGGGVGGGKGGGRDGGQGGEEGRGGACFGTGRILKESAQFPSATHRWRLKFLWCVVLLRLEVQFAASGPLRCDCRTKAL